MKSVGIRELKNRLSDYVRQVRSGERILITDRGEVVAEINPPGRDTMDETFPPGLVELARKGQLTLGRKDSATYRRPRGTMTSKEVAELLDEVRGPR